MLRQNIEAPMAACRSLNRCLALVAGCLALSACAGRHDVRKLPNSDGSFIVLVDYVHKAFGAQDVIVSLQEKQGLAAEVAVFRNIQSFQAAWIGPEDIGICQVGSVQDYKTHLIYNAHDGNHDFHFHYACPIP
jgi:hypothetical protein